MAPDPSTEAPKRRPVFFVSDHTGISAQVLGQALLSRFNGVQFRKLTEPFVTTDEKAAEVVAQIDATGEREGVQPIVFMTMTNPERAAQIHRARALVIDLFGAFTPALETELGLEASPEVGRFHGVIDQYSYKQRIDAVNFAMSTDDGLRTGAYEKADVILVGVSRSGKTPTCLYLALHNGIEAANYPLTPEDLETEGLPATLRRFRDKLFGLTIDPMRLHQIRTERRPDSAYSALSTCEREVRQAEAMFRRFRIPFINTSTFSVEEIAAHVMDRMKLDER